MDFKRAKTGREEMTIQMDKKPRFKKYLEVKLVEGKLKQRKQSKSFHLLAWIAGYMRKQRCRSRKLRDKCQAQRSHQD